MVNLKLKAADVMTPQVIVASPNMTVKDAGKIMNKFRIGGLPVVHDDKLVGIMTERCIMKGIIATDKKSGKVKVKDIMVKAPLITGKPVDSVEDIAKKMHKNDLTRIPILEKGKLVGIVTNKDVIESAPMLIDLIVEQAQMNRNFDSNSTSFGRCESCGRVGDLVFKENQFRCDDCSGVAKLRQEKSMISRFKLFG